MQEIYLYIVHGILKGKSHIYCVTTWKKLADNFRKDLREEYHREALVSKVLLQIAASI